MKYAVLAGEFKHDKKHYVLADGIYQVFKHAGEFKHDVFAGNIAGIFQEEKVKHEEKYHININWPMSSILADGRLSRGHSDFDVHKLYCRDGS